MIFILFMAHTGYLQVCNASCICFCSSSSNCLFEQMSLALCNNELITLYLLDMAWYKIFVTVPYSEGLHETFKNICKRYGIQVHFKSGKTIKDELVAPKDQDHITKKSGIIYRYKCDRLECNDEYIGETARTFGERFKEHLKAPSPIFDHSNISGHSTTINNFTVVGREEQILSRLIKESMFIRVNNPFLNKNIGKYHLPHIWNEVLVNNTELKLK